MYYYSVNEYLRKRFSEKVYKLSLNGGMTCPNRDGTIGTGGCIFCGSGGSGEFAASAGLSVYAQLEQAKLRVQSKTDCKKFIAYFQAFTNTYAPPGYLRKIFTEAASPPEIVALSIATRPDCLGDEVLEVLSDINQIKPVWVELGLQTIHPPSAEYIRRGYPLSVYDDAVRCLHSIGAEVITHVILGLPGETREMMLETVRYAGKVSDGIKLQLLHVLSDADLYDDYRRGMFETMTLDEYADLLCDCIENIPPNVVIHRLTGDGAKRLLVAPKWSGDKKRVLNTVNKALRDRDVVQGRALSKE